MYNMPKEIRGNGAETVEMRRSCGLFRVVALTICQSRASEVRGDKTCPCPRFRSAGRMKCVIADTRFCPGRLFYCLVKNDLFAGLGGFLQVEAPVVRDSLSS